MANKFPWTTPKAQTLYTTSSVGRLIAEYLDAGGQMLQMREGVLGHGDVLLYDNAGKLKTYVIREVRDAGGRKTSVVIYHNSLIISALYDTVEAAIKHLGGSRRETILPDGRVVIPESVNYPELAIRNIFVPFSAVRAEVWPGEPGWGK